MLSKAVWIGMRVGSKTGFLLSLLYSLPWILLFFALLLRMPVEEGLVLLIFVFVIGTVPATMLGMITGLIVGWWLGNFCKQITTIKSILAGVLVSSLLTGIVNLMALFLGNFSIASSEGAYWLFLGMPSVIYVFSSVFAGDKIGGHLRQPEIIETLALVEYFGPGPDFVMLIAGVFFILSGFVLGWLGAFTGSNISFLYSFLIIVVGVVVLLLFKSGKQNSSFDKANASNNSN